MSAPASRPKAYHRLKYAAFFADLAVGAALLALFQFTSVNSAAVRFAESASEYRTIQIAVYMSGFFAAFQIVSLPLAFFSGFSLEHRFGLSNQNVGGWFAQQAKSTALSLPLFVLSMEAVFWVGERFPDTWWIWAACGWFLLTAVLTTVLPTLVLPLFYPVRPLENGSVKEKVLALCREGGVRVLGAYRLGLSKTTKKANAALTGMGGSRRVLLADTLLEKYPEEEIEMVVAHEIGHHALGHIPRGLAFGGISAAAGFFALKLSAGAVASAAGADSLTDLAAFPALVFLASAAGLVMLPVRNAFSRGMEREADRYALERRPSIAVFRSLMERLERQNLGDPNPHPFVEFVFYSHPSLSSRLRHAESLSVSRDAVTVS